MRNKLITVVLIFLSLVLTAEAKKVTTKLTAPKTILAEKRKSHKTRPGEERNKESIAGKLTFMAYDKKSSASKETFFIDNGSNIPLSSLELEITYFTTNGKQIHKRMVEINQELPAKEARKVDIPSWDTQKSFHYINSVPGAKGSSPYTVKFRVLSYTKAAGATKTEPSQTDP